MIENTQKKPLRTLVLHMGDGKLSHTLERPFIIHFPGRNKQINSRVARKTFAVNFLDDTHSKEVVLITVARCSKKDQFCRRIGTSIAKGRLVKTTEVYLQHNVLGSDFFEKQPYCRVTNMVKLTEFPGIIFDHCTIPQDVVDYIVDIHKRFKSQVTQIEDNSKVIPF